MGEGTLGVDFANALASKDAPALRALMHERIEFRALTPHRSWEADSPEDVLEVVFGHWFEDGDEIRSLESVQTDGFADRERVGYRLAVHNPEGDFLVEQQAYIGESEGQIGWMRVVCSGFREV
jgi:hypothetical protein